MLFWIDWRSAVEKDHSNYNDAIPKHIQEFLIFNSLTKSDLKTRTSPNIAQRVLVRPIRWKIVALER